MSRQLRRTPALLLAAGLVFLAGAATSYSLRPEPVRYAPSLDLDFDEIDGRAVTRALHHRDHRVVVVAFASSVDDPPQRELLTHLQDLYERNHERGLEVVFLDALATLDELRALRDELHLTIRLGVPRPGLGERFGWYVFPTTYVFNRYGIVGYSVAGYGPRIRPVLDAAIEECVSAPIPIVIHRDAGR